jgi:Ca-activated chloride channel family protein
MGSEGVVNVPAYVNTPWGRKKVMTQMVSTINPTLLMKIADETGGKFYRAADADSMRRIFADIGRLERSKIEKKDRVLWSEHFQIFLALALIALIADLTLRTTVYRVLPE